MQLPEPWNKQISQEEIDDVQEFIANESSKQKDKDDLNLDLEDTFLTRLDQNEIDVDSSGQGDTTLQDKIRD